MSKNNKFPPGKHPGGRPTDYRPEYCKIARQLLKEGWSKIEIAAHFDVNRATLNYWAEKHEEFYNTINDGVEFSEATWTKWGRENLSNKEFNSRLYEINMTNRFGWNKKIEQKQEIKITHEEALKEIE